MKSLKNPMTNAIYIASITAIYAMMLEPGGIDHLESDRNSQFELNRNSQCTLTN